MACVLEACLDASSGDSAIGMKDLLINSPLYVALKGALNALQTEAVPFAPPPHPPSVLGSLC